MGANDGLAAGEFFTTAGLEGGQKSGLIAGVDRPLIAQRQLKLLVADDRREGVCRQLIKLNHSTPALAKHIGAGLGQLAVPKEQLFLGPLAWATPLAPRAQQAIALEQELVIAGERPHIAAIKLRKR